MESYHVDVWAIAYVIQMVAEGLEFYRDKKIYVNAVKDFDKNMKEKKEMVKFETYYEMDLIKKL